MPQDTDGPLAGGEEAYIKIPHFVAKFPPNA